MSFAFLNARVYLTTKDEDHIILQIQAYLKIQNSKRIQNLKTLLALIWMQHPHCITIYRGYYTVTRT